MSESKTPSSEQPAAANREFPSYSEENDPEMTDYNERESSEESYYPNEPKVKKCMVPLYKALILFMGKIMRVVLQVGDLYYCICITNIYVEIVVIFLCSSAEMNLFVKLITFVVTFMFSCLIGNPISIAYWEFAQLRWIKYKNPFLTLHNILIEPLFPNFKVNVKTMADIVNTILGIIFWIYIAGVIIYNKDDGFLFDTVNSILLFYIPVVKYSIYYLAYFCIAVYALIKKDFEVKDTEDPFQTAMKRDDNTCCYGKGEKGKIFFYTKIVFSVLSLIFIIVQFIRFKVEILGILFVIFAVWLFSSVLSLAINMPVWIVQIFYRWDVANCIHPVEGNSKKIKNSPSMEGFKYWNMLGTSLGFVIVLLFMCFLLLNNGSDFEKVQAGLNRTGNFTGTAWTVEPRTDLVKSAMCYSEIHGLNFIQLSALAQATYMDNETEMMDLYNKCIFKDLNIKSMKYLAKVNNDAVVLQTDFELPTEKVTVLSIRGSMTSLDWWLDLEIFSSSAMLTFARFIPLIQRLESKTTKTITAFLTIPLRTLEEMTLVKKYTDTLSKTYEKFLADPNNKNKTVIFSGHSLAGGLSKYMGNKYNKHSFSVSGPGITPLEYKFPPEDGYNKYFKSTFIDIVPDNDFIPRFETSGGIRYRVLCEATGNSCHSIDQTLCMMGLMCDSEEYTGDLCHGIFKSSYYENLRKVSMGL